MAQKFCILLIVLSIAFTARAANQRGIYISIHNDHIGTLQLTGDLADYSYILGDTKKETTLIDWLVANSFNSITLYDMRATFADEMQPTLASFMQRARAAGITRIEAVGGVSSSDYTNIIDFHKNYAKFDGVVTEVEFWNGDGTVADVVNAVKQVKAANLLDSNNKAVTVSAYIGWPQQSDINTIVTSGLDRFYLHAYTKDGTKTYSYAHDRLDMIKTANSNYETSVAILVLFSAEGVQYNAAGSTPFMGDWIQTNGFQKAEDTFEASWTSDARTVPSQLGYQYYEYVFARAYTPIAKTTTPTVTPTTPTAIPITTSKSSSSSKTKAGLGSILLR